MEKGFTQSSKGTALTTERQAEKSTGTPKKRKETLEKDDSIEVQRKNEKTAKKENSTAITD